MTASDVDDPGLAEMLRLFDEIPEVPAPNGATWSLATREGRTTIKAGWLKQGWKEDALWPAEADPRHVLRRWLGDRVLSNYQRVIQLAQERTERSTN